VAEPDSTPSKLPLLRGVLIVKQLACQDRGQWRDQGCKCPEYQGRGPTQVARSSSDQEKCLKWKRNSRHRPSSIILVSQEHKKQRKLFCGPSISHNPHPPYARASPEDHDSAE
jgi:hypothetical protein